MQGFEERDRVFFLSDSKSEEWKKLEMLIWRFLARHMRKLEYRIQSSYRYVTNPQRQLAELESDIYRYIL